MRHEVDSDFKWVISLVTPPPSIPFFEGKPMSGEVQVTQKTATVT